MENIGFVQSQAVCFTGHRRINEPLPEVERRVTELTEKLIQKGYLYFFAGGARGFDALASEVILKLEEKYPQIQLVLVLPFDEQYKRDRGWKASEIKQYQRLKEQASKVIVLASEYSSSVYHKRNKYLVDSSSVCIAYMARKNSGTGYTVKYAKSKGLEIVNIYHK